MSWKIRKIKDWQTHLLIFGLFIVLTIIMTYPLVLNPASSVRSTGDTLLNTWIIAWDVHKIASLDFKDFFNANIFYPYKRTLAYSEYLLPQALFALPILLISGNPLLAYNCVLWLAFITSGFGMYLLARYLAKNTLAAVIAGIIYSFSPFMISQLAHLQILTAGGIPLTFLFLHKFFEQEKNKDLLLFALFYLLQGLANSYYALYLTLFAGLFILFFIISRRKYRDWFFLMKLGLAGVIVGVLASPFFYQYLQLRKEMGFVRHRIYSAIITSFLSTPSLNRVYGKLFALFYRQGAQLFPGFIPSVLAILGIIFCLAIKRTKEDIPKSQKRISFSRCGEKNLGIYFIILVCAFLFVFGLKGPYYLLYKYIPGFNGLRAGARIHVFIMFSLAIFAAFGIRGLLLKLRGLKKQIISILVLLLILIEYLSIPIPTVTLPAKMNIPEVYKWLALKKGESFAILELPFPPKKRSVAKIECPRMYYSTYHWKNLVNGDSGYYSPLYSKLRNYWTRTPLKQNIKKLKDIGVRYLILHSGLYKEKEFMKIRNNILKLKNDVFFVNQFGEAYVYELIYRPGERERIVKTLSTMPEKKEALQKKGPRIP